jgi:hypothetical protein
VPHDQISLVVLAPTVSGPLRDDLDALGCEISAEEPGIWRVAGLSFAAWLVETDVMAERGQPVLSLVSRLFLNDRASIMDRWAYGPFGRLVEWMVQQVRQFDPEEDFAVQQALSENLEELQEQLLTKMLERTPHERLLRVLSPEELARALPPEERVRGLSPEERVRGLPPEERVRGLPPEERVRGLSPEQRLAGLSEQEVARMRELLQRKKE